MDDVQKCFVCNSEDVHWECISGCGDYYCDDCAEGVDYTCEICGFLLQPMD